MLSLFTSLLIAAGLVGLVVVLRIVADIRSPLRGVPGPFTARFTRLWYLRRLHARDFEKVNVQLHRKYGKIVRLSPNRYTIDDLEAAKIIYGPGSKFRKSEWYYGWAHPDRSRFTIFTARDMTLHAAERRKYSAAYSMSTLVSYEPLVDNCIQILEQRLLEFASAGRRIDLGHWMQCYAFDVIGEITFSRRFGFLNTGLDVGQIISTLENKAFYSTLVGVYPELHPYLFPLINYIRGAKATGDAYIREVASDAIAERKTRIEKTNDGPADFVTKFLESHAEDPEKFTSQNILVGCLTNVLAGSDTTSITLSAILYYLLNNNRCVQKLRTEIETLRNDGTISFPPSFKDSQKMPYLQAVIKEALRMHPATGLPLERVTPQGGATIAGKFFPEGTIVGINSWTAHRSHVFDPDPDVFRPERWIPASEADQVNISRMDRYFMPFGLGSRTCLGKHISYLEINKVIPLLVEKFDFKLVQDGAPINSDVTGQIGAQNYWQTSNLWFVKPVGFKVAITLRQT